MKTNKFPLLISLFLSLAACQETPSAEKVTPQKNNQTTATEKSTVKKTVAETPNETVAKTSSKKPAIVEQKTQATTSARKRPALTFSETTFDYGIIEQGAEVNHRFAFTNTGNADLVIKSAKATCGCTTPSYPFMPVAPGEQGEITVKFSSVGKMGTQKPMITVTSNATPNVSHVYLTGFVTSPKSESLPKTLPLDSTENNAKGE
jgi:outer membrane biosynthesis protein TonB